LREAERVMKARDMVGIIEAAYRIDCAEQEWLEGLVASAQPLLDRGLGLSAMLYDVSRPGGVCAFVSAGTPEGWSPTAIAQQVRDGDGASAVAQLLSARPCATASESAPPGGRDPTADYRSQFGIHDVLGINGSDANGAGVFIGVHLPAPTRLRPATRTLWSSIAVHMATGHRLRTRLAASERAADDTPAAEAVIETNGKIAHAEAPASSKTAQRLLAAAVNSVERARGPLRGDAPERAVAEWKGLVAARWTLLEHFERDGRRYLLARKNDPTVPDFERLTERERQVVAFASLGHQNKLIAYELGIATSTVGVLLSRAMKKLGVPTRARMIEAFRRRAAQSRET
jgi:DNA-binding CsgD family transcriptional regulator